jgi:hypothetical protein
MLRRCQNSGRSEWLTVDLFVNNGRAKEEDKNRLPPLPPLAQETGIFFALLLTWRPRAHILSAAGPSTRTANDKGPFDCSPTTWTKEVCYYGHEKAV